MGYLAGGSADFNLYKPEGFKDYLTRHELCELVDRDRTRIRELERKGKLPLPIRVKVGKVMVRLYSPEHVANVVAFFEARPKRRRRRRRTT